MTKKVSKPKKEDSLLAHCVARAMVEDQGGVDAATEKWGPNAERLSRWSAMKAGRKATAKASRVASFMVMWAVAMQDEGAEEYSITEYQRYWNEGERQSYRLQGEFRDLWPEYETPSEPARQILVQLKPKMSKVEIAMLPTRVVVKA